MSFDRLHPELWVHILSFLTVPHFKPLSGWTKEEAVGENPQVVACLPAAGDPSVTKRSDMRVTALAVLMRTSLAFNKLARRPLYKRIVTDRWAALSHSVDNRSPAHPELESPLQLLQYTTHLQIEYRSKFGDISYEEILRGDWRNWLIIGATTPLEAAMTRGVIEIDDDPSEPLGSMVIMSRATPFPNLTHFTVGAIFGGQDGVWDVAADHRLARFGHRKTRIDPETSVWDVLADSKRKMQEIWRRTALKEYCQRGNAGPLSLPPAVHWSDHGLTPLFPPPIFNFHSHVGMQSSEIPVGRSLPCRWLQDVLDPSLQPLSILPVLRKALMMAYRLRYKPWAVPAYRADTAQNYSIDIFANPSDDQSPYYTSAVPGKAKELCKAARTAFDEDQRAEAAKLAKTLLQDVPNEQLIGREKKDVIEWKPAVDFPHCAACGWNYGEILGKGC